MTLQACAEIVRKGDPDRFLATMAAPPAAREKLFPLYAFNVEVSRAPWVTAEPMIAEMRLQWWRDVLEDFGAGKPPRKHEVVDPLASILSPDSVQILDQLVQARRWDIYKDPFEDDAHFAEYLTNTAGGLLLASSQSLGADLPEPALCDLGYASGLANWFVAIPALVAAGRVPLVDGRPEAVAELARDALTKFNNAEKSLKTRGHPAILATWRARAILQMVVKDPRRVGDGTLNQPEFQRRASLLWRSFRR